MSYNVETPFRTWKQAAEFVGVVTELEGWYWGRGVNIMGRESAGIYLIVVLGGIVYPNN